MLKLAAALAVVLGAMVPVFTPCATEDSTACNWDSGAHGNGRGISYVALTEQFSIQYAAPEGR